MWLPPSVGVHHASDVTLMTSEDGEGGEAEAEDGRGEEKEGQLKREQKI